MHFSLLISKQTLETHTTTNTHTRTHSHTHTCTPPWCLVLMHTRNCATLILCPQFCVCFTAYTIYVCVCVFKICVNCHAHSLPHSRNYFRLSTIPVACCCGACFVACCVDIFATLTFYILRFTVIPQPTFPHPSPLLSTIFLPLCGIWQNCAMI